MTAIQRQIYGFLYSLAILGGSCYHAVVLARGGAATTTSSDRSNNDGPRNLVLGGRDATPDRYNFFTQMEGGCGAALIASDLILTAAHCLKTTEISNSVHVGAYESLNGNVRNITSVGVHPLFNSSTMEFDLMIMKLNAPVDNIVPVKLNSNPEIPAVGWTLTVIGMGATSAGTDRGFDLLQEANVFALAETECSVPYGPLWKGELSMLCAGIPDGGVDSCRGDSGGPLLDADDVFLVGVVSVGMTCGDKDFPGIYARISHSIAWVQNQICLMTDFPPDYCPDKENAVTIVISRPTDNTTTTAGGSNGATATATTPPPVHVSPIKLLLEINYDAYGIENSWQLRNTDIDEVIDSVDFYSVYEEGLVNNTYEQLTHGNYTFVIYDYASDGMCCSFGDGYIRITDLTTEGRGRVIWYQPGNNFTSQASVSFQLTDPYYEDHNGITSSQSDWISISIVP